MNDLLNTIIPLGKSIINKSRKKFGYLLHFGLKENLPIHQITKHCEDKIKDALNGAEDMQKTVDLTLESLSIMIHRNHLYNDVNKKLIFEQIIIFINFLFSELKSKYIFNTLNNNLEEFNKQSIGDNVNNLVQNGKDGVKLGCSCIHYALFFKKVFDELEKTLKLGTSNYLFLEKYDQIDHSGLIVTFNGKNYLIDLSRFNGMFMQPIENLGKHFDRMKTLKDFYKEDIAYSSIQTIVDEYNKNDDNYYKVMIKTSHDLLFLLDSIPKKVGGFGRMYNILGDKLRADFIISKEGIQLLGTFTYHFDHIISKKELDSINNNELMDYLTNCISYKTDINNKVIKVFDFEKKYIRDTLYYFSDKIDYSLLRRIISNK